MKFWKVEVSQPPAGESHEYPNYSKFCLCANMLKSLHHLRRSPMSGEWRGSDEYSVRIHILVTEQGELVEFFLEPGVFSDTSALGLYNFDIPVNSFITDDKAYNQYLLEDVMCEAGIEFLPLRKKNSLRPVPAYMIYFQACVCKIVETTGGLIERLLPKSIHAVTAKGFEIKVALFVLACSVNFFWW